MVQILHNPNFEPPNMGEKLEMIVQIFLSHIKVRKMCKISSIQLTANKRYGQKTRWQEEPWEDYSVSGVSKGLGFLMYTWNYAILEYQFDDVVFWIKYIKTYTENEIDGKMAV
jgi:glycerol-3-phosphate O-acyltransferase